MGAVTGDHSFLKIVTNATTRPPIAPTMIQGPATEGSSAVRTCAHTHAAGRTTKNNRNAVRFTVPSTVIAGAVGSRRTSANALILRLRAATGEEQPALLVHDDRAHTDADVVGAGFHAEPRVAVRINAPTSR